MEIQPLQKGLRVGFFQEGKRLDRKESMDESMGKGGCRI